MCNLPLAPIALWREKSLKLGENYVQFRFFLPIGDIPAFFKRLRKQLLTYITAMIMTKLNFFWQIGMKVHTYDIINLTVTRISKNWYVEFCTLAIVNHWHHFPEVYATLVLGCFLFWSRDLPNMVVTWKSWAW